MKNLISNFKKLDVTQQGGIIFIVAFIIPCIIAVFQDVFTNGSNML